MIQGSWRCPARAGCPSGGRFRQARASGSTCGGNGCGFSPAAHGLQLRGGQLDRRRRFRVFWLVSIVCAPHFAARRPQGAR